MAVHSWVVWVVWMGMVGNGLYEYLCAFRSRKSKKGAKRWCGKREHLGVGGQLAEKGAASDVIPWGWHYRYLIALSISALLRELSKSWEYHGCSVMTNTADTLVCTEDMQPMHVLGVCRYSRTKQTAHNKDISGFLTLSLKFFMWELYKTKAMCNGHRLPQAEAHLKSLIFSFWKSKLYI